MAGNVALQLSALATPWDMAGIVCAIASAASTVVGMLLQKEGLKRENNMLFYGGVVIFSVAKPVTQIAALYCAPLMLIAPLSSFTILLNAVIVPYCQNEPLKRRDVLIGMLLVGGCIGTSLAGAHGNNSWSYNELVELGSEPETEALTAVLFGALFGLSAALKVARTRLSDMPLGIVLVALSPSIASALNNVMLKLLINALTSAPWQALVFLIGTVGISAFLQVWSTTIGVQLFDMLAFVPVQISEQILVTTVYSIVFFKEVPSNPLAFALASAAVVLGVLLTQSQSIKSDKDYIQIVDDAPAPTTCAESPGSTRCPSLSESASGDLRPCVSV